MMSFLLTPLYVTPGILDRDEYGRVSQIFAYMIFMNVILAYGMETSFFRFYNKETNKKDVIETSIISIFWTSLLFLALALILRGNVAAWIGIDVQYVTYAIWILVLDALAIVPFSKLRATAKPMRYAVIKMGNVTINVLLNLFFLLWLPKIAEADPNSFIGSLYFEDYQIGYIFVSNVIASLLTFVVLSGDYMHVSWHFNTDLWKRMMRYGFPILFAGIAFAINEQFDKILLGKLLPPNVADSQVGVYSACYKLGLFMVLFRTAYTLGIEPFFFSHASHKNAPKTYATVTKYFVISGSCISLAVIVFSDLLKRLMIPNVAYWEAMKIVPLIILANFFLGIYTNLSVWYKLIDKTYIGAYISLIGAIVTLALNFLLIPKYSYMGSAIATIAAYGTMMTISYFWGNKYYPIPYDAPKIGGYLAVSIAFSGIYFYFFRENYFVGIPMLLAFGYFVYHNEKETIQRIMRRKPTD